MKQFITRAQELGRKAAELKQTVQGLPAQAAKIREAVTMTGGELQQLRTEVQSSIHALRADSEDRLLKTMREINDNAELFREAGYDLSGMDLDLSVHQRLTVHLDKDSDVSLSTIRSLQTRSGSETVRSLMGAIVKAEEIAANVELTGLLFAGVLVHVGAIPLVRLCWRPELPISVTPSLAAAPPAATVTVQTPAQTAPAPEKSMFELRPLPGGSIRITAPHESNPVEALSHIAPPQASPAESAGWSRDALERFKKMPNVSKYGR